MFRKRLLLLSTVNTTALSGVTLTAPARAQEVIDLDAMPTPKKGGKKAGGGARPGGVDIDLDEGAPAQGGPAAVTAGQMTEPAAAAKQMFDKEKWSEAAQALHRVVSGETGDDAGNKQLAEYYLAICLYRLKFYQASYAIFSVVADNPNHLKFKETLLWLAKLALQLPEPADIIERVGKYSDDQVARFDNAQQRDLYWQLNYMLGRYKYRNRQYEEAIRLFQLVDRNSPHYVKSQFFTGISYVQLRKSVPGVKAFQRILKALDEGGRRRRERQADRRSGRRRRRATRPEGRRCPRRSSPGG
jgi:tetratricopeptide (TPR) repeat protein